MKSKVKSVYEVSEGEERERRIASPATLNSSVRSAPQIQGWLQHDTPRKLAIKYSSVSREYANTNKPELSSSVRPCSRSEKECWNCLGAPLGGVRSSITSQQAGFALSRLSALSRVFEKHAVWRR